MGLLLLQSPNVWLLISGVFPRKFDTILSRFLTEFAPKRCIVTGSVTDILANAHPFSKVTSLHQSSIRFRGQTLLPLTQAKPDRRRYRSHGWQCCHIFGQHLSQLGQPSAVCREADCTSHSQNKVPHLCCRVRRKSSLCLTHHRFYQLYYSMSFDEGGSRSFEQRHPAQFCDEFGYY